MRYSIKPRDCVFVKGFELLSFAKSKGKNIGKNIGKNSQKRLDYAQKF